MIAIFWPPPSCENNLWLRRLDVLNKQHAPLFPIMLFTAEKITKQRARYKSKAGAEKNREPPSLYRRRHYYTLAPRWEA